MASLQKQNYDLRQLISDVEFDPEDPFNELKILPLNNSVPSKLFRPLPRDRRAEGAP